MRIMLDCPLCKIYVILPLKQFKKRDNNGGLFLDNLKCINCGEVYKPDLMFGDNK